MIILFKYCDDMKKCESFRGFSYIYIYIYIYRMNIDQHNHEAQNDYVKKKNQKHTNNPNLNYTK